MGFTHETTPDSSSEGQRFVCAHTEPDMGSSLPAPQNGQLRRPHPGLAVLLLQPRPLRPAPGAAPGETDRSGRGFWPGAQQTVGTTRRPLVPPLPSWANCSASLCPDCVVCKMGVIVPTSQGCWELGFGELIGHGVLRTVQECREGSVR